MPLSAADVLKAAEAEEALLKATVQVERPLEQVNDVGNLLGREENDLEINKCCDEDYLCQLARDNVQVRFRSQLDVPSLMI